jgi:hypothetical protein
MCADILLGLGYDDVVLVAPRGGADGGKDITFRFDGDKRGLACVTLRKDIATKFVEDFHQRRPGDYARYYLFCTAYVTSTQKTRFTTYCEKDLKSELVIQDIEALRSLIDVRFAEIKNRCLGVSRTINNSREIGHDISLSSWVGYVHSGDPSVSLGFGIRDSDDMPYLMMKALGEEFVGFNRCIPGTRGSIEIEYQIVSGQTKDVNIAFYAIPMGKRWNGHSMEDYELRLENDVSARQEYVPPSHHIADGKWHKRPFSFDFQELPDVMFVIFAPRINEGRTNKGLAHVLFTSVHVPT